MAMGNGRGLRVRSVPGAPAGGAAVGRFVAFSEIGVPEAGKAALEAAFADRLGAVERSPGFQGLQVWADAKDPCEFVMVSWWDSRECFAAYMTSQAHRSSHQRIPTGANRPRPRRFRRYEVIAQ
jgi:heme-degrading monooxygenase HmoA